MGHSYVNKGYGTFYLRCILKSDRECNLKLLGEIMLWTKLEVVLTPRKGAREQQRLGVLLK